MRHGRAGGTRRRVVGTGAALAGAGALAACGGSGATGTGAGGDRPGAGGPPPATILTSNWVDHGFAMQAYMEEFPQIKVDYTFAGTTDPHYAKVQASAVAGTPLDAFWVHDALVTQITGGGMARPLDEYVRRDRDATDDIYPVALKYHTRNGRLYGIPQNLSIYLVYYDADRFREVGLPAPRSDWTLDQFLDAAQRVTRSAGDRFGVQIGAGDRRGYWMFLKGHGGGWVSEDGTRSRLMDAETVTGGSRKRP